MDDEVHFSLEDLSEITGYHIDREINHGGYCTVFHGTDSKSGIEAAVKVEFRKKSIGHRLLREASLIKKIKHPNLVRYMGHGYAETSKGKIRFLAEEFLPGGSVQDALENITCFSMNACVKHIVSLCDFLSYLHSTKRILLDIKPENLMFDANGTLKIVDLATAQRCPHISFGTVIGTPPYISPEYASLIRDHRSDIFTAGVLFYTMMTGNVPIDTDKITNPVHPDQLRNLFMNNNYLRMNCVRPGIPQELVDIQEKMMNVNIIGRYQSMAAVLKDLGDFSQRHNLNISPHSAEL